MMIVRWEGALRHRRINAPFVDSSPVTSLLVSNYFISFFPSKDASTTNTIKLLGQASPIYSSLFDWCCQGGPSWYSLTLSCYRQSLRVLRERFLFEGSSEFEFSILLEFLVAFQRPVTALSAFLILIYSFATLPALNRPRI